MNEVQITQDELNAFNATPVEETHEEVNQQVVETNENSGVIVSAEEFDMGERPEAVKAGTDISENTLADVARYMEERPKELEEYTENQNQDNEEEDEDDVRIQSVTTVNATNATMTPEEFDEKYQKAMIIIDKAGVGSVDNLGLTEEEHEKLKLASSITLNEVETIDLATIKVKPFDRKKININKIIKKTTSPLKTNIVLPMSGYVAVMKGCSVYDLMNLFRDKNNIASSFQTKWSVIYDNIESTSLGKMSFNDFLLNTAFSDLNMFIYGILCATYTKEDTYTVACANDKCMNKIAHKYSMKSLLRAEQFSDRALALIDGAINNSYTKDDAKAWHEQAPVMVAKRIKLPESGIIVTLQIKSAYDMINNTAMNLDDLSAMDKEKYQDASLISLTVSEMYIPDEGEYYKLTDSTEVIKAIYQLSELDNKVLIKLVNELNEGLDIEFGLAKVKCDKCGEEYASIPVDMDSILFQKYQRAIKTEV